MSSPQTINVSPWCKTNVESLGQTFGVTGDVAAQLFININESERTKKADGKKYNVLSEATGATLSLGLWTMNALRDTESLQARVAGEEALKHIEQSWYYLHKALTILNSEREISVRPPQTPAPPASLELIPE